MEAADGLSRRRKNGGESAAAGGSGWRKTKWEDHHRTQARSTGPGKILKYLFLHVPVRERERVERDDRVGWR